MASFSTILGFRLPDSAMKAALTVLGLLQVADGVFTRFAVGSGLAHERNPLVASYATTSAFVLVKIVGAVLCCVFLRVLYRRFPRLAAASAVSVVVFCAAVLAWNVNAVLGA